jgi:hypothetical protein
MKTVVENTRLTPVNKDTTSKYTIVDLHALSLRRWANELARVADRIDQFNAHCDAAGHTRTDEVWELFGNIFETLTGRKLGG